MAEIVNLRRARKRKRARAGKTPPADRIASSSAAPKPTSGSPKASGAKAARDWTATS